LELSTKTRGIPAGTAPSDNPQMPAPLEFLKMATKQEVQIETVKMDDGRTVDFAGKRRVLKESIIGADGSVKVRMDFRNGETRTWTIPSNLMARCAAHGAEQKLGDEMAGLDDLDDAVLAVHELRERLERGEWGTQRTSNGLAGTSILVRALMESTGKDATAVKAFLSNKTQAEKIALRNNPRLKPIIERLEAEKASKGSKVDTDALLDELA